MGASPQTMRGAEENIGPILLVEDDVATRKLVASALAEEGLSTREIAGRLKMKEFPARKALQHAERYSRGELDAALVRLAELDAAIKGASRLSAELEQPRALIDVTRPAAPALSAAAD